MTQRTVKPNRIGSNFLFLGKFLRHGITIASIWPSSKSLAKATVKEVDFDKAKVIVELGAGTGPITDVIIQRLKPHTRFIAIERDADFARILHERFSGLPNVEIVHADVRDLETVLRDRGITEVDFFLSGLATPTLPEPVRLGMLACVRRYMAEHGVFSNITEIPYIYWKYYKSLFHDVDFQIVVANMPPGGVYHCRAMR
jgi:phosphatidylethanolamine/phosphatidyl-N-methylethanolamine N-methyltransferase